MAAATLRSKPSCESVSQFRFFVLNYMHTGRVSHCVYKTKVDDLFINTPYHFKAFKPVLLSSNLGAQKDSRSCSDWSWGQKLNIMSKYGDRSEVWSSDGIMIRAGPGLNFVKGGSGGGGGGGFDSNGKGGCWGRSFSSGLLSY